MIDQHRLHYIADLDASQDWSDEDAKFVKEPETPSQTCSEGLPEQIAGLVETA